MKNPIFSIITPSLNMLEYIKSCVRSVSDQNIEHEHLIVDGGSTDGTVEWFTTQENLSYISEKDNGMYDAINKGLRQSRGEILAYLNCDEQYLPNTFKEIQQYFELHTNVDIVFGNALFLDKNGDLLAYRKGFPPRWFYIQMGYLYLPSCAMFFRRRILDKGLIFDTHWKTIGDADFVLRAMNNGFNLKYFGHFLSAFTFTGQNLGSSKLAIQENNQLHKLAPKWARFFKHLAPIGIKLERLLYGSYFEKMPIEYEIFTTGSPHQRKKISANHVSPFYPKRI